jgi:hypothetical protein
MWEGSIKMELKEIGQGDMDWISPAQDRDVAGCCEHVSESWGSVTCRGLID